MDRMFRQEAATRGAIPVSRRSWFGRRRSQWVGALVVSALTGAAAPALAADHLDSPAGTTDPAADIVDVFAFTSPQRANRLVVILDTHPGAFAGAQFSDQIVYSFRVRPTATTDARELRIDCSFTSASPQTGTCTAYAFATASRRVFIQSSIGGIALGQPTAERGGLRIFAGMRAEPFYIDADQIRTSIAGGAWRFADGGVNPLAFADVLSIAIEIDVARFLPSLDNTTVRVAGETTIKVVP